MRFSCLTSKFVWVVLDDVNVFQWNREWFFSRRVKFDSGFNVMVVYEVSWHGPKSFIASPASGNESEVVKETLLILEENLRDLLLELDVPVSRWMFSVPDLFQKVWFVHLQLEYHLFRIESFRIDFRCVHRLQLLIVCNQYVTVPNSTRVQSVSKEQSRWDFLSTLMDSGLIFRSYRVILNKWTKGNNKSFEWLPKTSLIGRLPIRQQVCDVSQIGVTFHRICRPTFI